MKEKGFLFLWCCVCIMYVRLFCSAQRFRLAFDPEIKLGCGKGQTFLEKLIKFPNLNILSCIRLMRYSPNIYSPNIMMIFLDVSTKVTQNTITLV